MAECFFSKWLWPTLGAGIWGPSKGFPKIRCLYWRGILFSGFSILGSMEEITRFPQTPTASEEYPDIGRCHNAYRAAWP